MWLRTGQSATAWKTQPTTTSWWRLFRTVPVLATGIVAWQFQLEGQTLKGILLQHLVLGSISTVIMCLVGWIHRSARRKASALPGYRFAIEFIAIAIVALTAHLGGVLSGVNG